MDGSFAPNGATFSFSITTKALARIKASVDRKHALPILTTAHVVASGQSVRFTGTDFTTTVRVTVPAVVSSAGAACIEPAAIVDAAKSAGKGGVVCVTTTDASATFATGVRTTVPCGLIADFPATREPEGAAVLALDAGELRALIGRVSASMSTDLTRPHLTALLIERVGGVLRLVTTDGHRLSKVERANAGVDFRLLIPAAAIGQADRLLGAVKGTAEIRFGTSKVSAETRADYAWISVGEDWVGSRLVDAAFPSYEQVIPNCADREVLIPTAPFLAALTACAKVASDRTAGVVFAFRGGDVVISASNPERGVTKSDPIGVVLEGADITIGFNSMYIIDALATVTNDTFTLHLSGELDPGMIVDGEFIAVAMPMKL
jgi:DNA polymerase-3 subunit beta